MKYEQKKPEKVFQPVLITVETLEEAEEIVAALGHVCGAKHTYKLFCWLDDLVKESR